MLDMIQDVFMLGLVVWREARGEPHDGKIAVAHSIMNRVKRPSWWGDSVMAVARKKWQYSSLTDPKDPQVILWPDDHDPVWMDCLAIAFSVWDGSLHNPVPGADSYYSDTMPVPPKWADPEKFVMQIGHHRFYNLDSDHERTAL